MNPKHIESYLIDADDLASNASIRVISINGGTLFAVDDKGKLVGSLTKGDLLRNARKGVLNNLTKVNEICVKDCVCVIDNEYFRLHAMCAFIDNPKIEAIPVLNDDRIIMDIYFKYQAFFKNCLDSPFHPPLFQLPALQYKHYAHCILQAADEAKKLGYDKISVIEFGVAGGNGLVFAEQYSVEIEKMLGVNIEVYGFDSGEGLPKADDYRDVPYVFSEGFYKMDEEKLRNRLRKSKLIIGDIKETVKCFFELYCPAPIGAMLLDVDLYSSTVPILNMLLEDDKNFLPRVVMYFDDVYSGTVFQGELLAISEFNRSNENLKISPELLDQNVLLEEKVGKLYSARIKECHRFNHEKYGNNINNYQQLRLL